MRKLGAVLIFVGVNTAVYSFPLLPDEPFPALIKWAFVDLGLLFAVLGMTMIARAKRAS
jgi:hypothetical protein